MKEKWQKRLFNLPVGIGLILFLFCVYQMNEMVQKSQQTIDKVFHQALDLDLFERLQAPQVNKITIPGKIKNDKEVPKGLHIRSASGDTIISYTKERSREKFFLDNRYIDHTATRILNPINPCYLEKRLVALLDSADIRGKAAIIYYDKKAEKHLHSNPDMRMYHSVFHSELIQLGVENEIEVQAFVRFSPHWLLQPAGKSIRGCFYLILVYLLYVLDSRFSFMEQIFFKRRKQKQSCIRLLLDGNYQLGSLHLNVQTGILTGKESLNIGKRQEYILLLAFLHAPDFKLSRQSLFDILKKSDERNSNQVNMIISRLRKLLEEEPRLQINYIEPDYYLHG